MELRQLQYFVAIAEELSFRRAANRLRLSHPSLSQQIANLESELGMKLFKRSSRQIELTEAGRVFLSGIRQALRSIRRAAAQAQEVAKGERGRLVIGNIGLLTQRFLPGALAAFRARYPLVEVTVSHMNSHAQAEALLDGLIMLGIGYLDEGVDEDTRQLLATELLLRSPFGIIYSGHRRFPKHHTPVLTDFRDDRFLAFAPEVSPIHANLIHELCQEIAGFEPQVEAIANSKEDIVSMVTAGRGVWLAPAIAVTSHPQGINFQLLETTKRRFEVFVIWNKQVELPAAAQQFVKVLKEFTNSGNDGNQERVVKPRPAPESKSKSKS
jgi:DNA-binding transcriptional LysR family regulator